MRISFKDPGTQVYGTDSPLFLSQLDGTWKAKAESKICSSKASEVSFEGEATLGNCEAYSYLAREPRETKYSNEAKASQCSIFKVPRDREGTHPTIGKE